MGTFLVRQVEPRSGLVLAQYQVPNDLAYEGLDVLYHRLFPSLSSAATFVLGVSGCSLRDKEDRPNPMSGTLSLGRTVTWAGLTDVQCDGGCYSYDMQEGLAYARQAVTFDEQRNAGGSEAYSPTKQFTNPHEWTPEDCDHWDDPATEPEIEQCPAPWRGKAGWQVAVGYPWHVPRILAMDLGDEGGPCQRSYWKEVLDETGCDGEASSLDWLADFRLLGGFPITCVYLADQSREQIVAIGRFVAPVLLHAGCTLHVRYRARVVGIVGRHGCVGVITTAFARRFMARAFTTGASAYDTIYARPVLLGAPAPSRALTYDDVEPWFDPDLAAVALTSWTYVGYPTAVNPYIYSNAPTFTNAADPERAIGPLAALAVYGVIGETEELMWLAPFDEPASVPHGDGLRIPDGVRFELRSV